MPAPAEANPNGTRRGRPLTGGKGKKKTLDGARSRDHEVVEAAVQLFFQKGYAATSIQDVADELGMLKGSLYYYIDGKESLLKRIFETSHQQVQEIAEKYRETDAPAFDRLCGFLREYALWYLNNIPRASLFAREWRHASDDLRSVMVEQRRYYDLVLRELIYATRQDHELDPSSEIAMIGNFIMSAVSSLPDWFQPAGARSAGEVADCYVKYSVRVLLGPKVSEVDNHEVMQ